MTNNHIGKTLYQASELPAINDTTAFEALTWGKVYGVQTLLQMGVTHGLNDIKDPQTALQHSNQGGYKRRVQLCALSGDPT